MGHLKNNDIELNKSGKNNLRKLYTSIREIQYDFRNANLYNLLINYLKGCSVLDVGSGPGHFLYIAQQHYYNINGLEVDPQLIALGEKLYPEANLNIQCGTAENLKIDQLFDNITMIDVLEHIKDEEQVLCRFKNYLSDTGRLIIVVPAHPSLYGIRDRSIGHYRRYSKRHIVNLIKDCGMKPIKARHWNVIGVIPFFISEKIFRRPLQASLREHDKQKGFKAVFAKMMFSWFRFIENKVDFHFGLSLVVIAENNIENNRKNLLKEG